MATKTWTLTDLSKDINVDLNDRDVEGGAAGFSVRKAALRGGLREGVDVIEVDNGRFSFVVVPTRGMGIWRARCGDLQLGWRSPVHGPVHPSLVRLNEASGLGWLDGFDELLVRCGLESNGAPEFDDKGELVYPLHGKIANLPAHTVELSVDGDAGIISVAGIVDEARLFGNKLRLTSTITTTVGEPSITIRDEVSNVWGEPSELELLYHVNFGLPLLGPGSKVVMPVKKVAPRDQVAVDNVSHWDSYSEGTPGLPEAVFFFELLADDGGSTQTLLRNANADRGVSLLFDNNQLPCFTLWKNRQMATDGYVTGLEPAINFPNIKSFEKAKGRVAVLQPGESRTFELTMLAHTDAESVAAAEKAIARIQGDTKPQVLGTPVPEWSAA